jgi:hypothetical protein
MDVAVAWPVAETLAVQLANGESNPPAGMVIVRRIVEEPETAPVTVPRPPAVVTDIVTVPVRSAPDWVTCMVIDPGPDESVAVPRQEPATFSVLADGAAGVSDLLLHPPVNASAQSHGTN